MSSQHDYIKMYKQLKTENLKLRQTIKLQAQAVEELNRLVSELKRRLGRHANYNTPPSQQKGSKMYSTKKKEEEEEKKEGRRIVKDAKDKRNAMVRQAAKDCVEVRGAARE